MAQSHVRIHVCCPFLICTIMLVVACNFNCKLLCDLSICFQFQISIPELIPIADFSSVFAFLMLHSFSSILRLASICSNVIWISDSLIGCCCVCARAVFGRAIMQASQSNTLPVGANSVRSTLLPKRIPI